MRTRERKVAPVSRKAEPLSDELRQREPKAGDIVVVNANLEELWQDSDIAQPGDMRSFAHRVTELIGRSPDILLLQEVVAAAADNVARYLKEVAGISYQVAVPPSTTPYSKQTKTLEYVRDTAILLNDKTMRAKRRKGFVATRHDPKDNRPDIPRTKAKEHAHVLAKHEPSGTRLALMSIHLIPGGPLPSRERALEYRAKWAGELCAFMRKTHPKRGRQITVLAGDFNARRTLGRHDTVNAEPVAFWTRLQDQGLSDAIFDIHGHSNDALENQHRKGKGRAKGVDYIFTDGDVIEASHDLDPAPEGEPGFYSDHRFLWAIIRPPRARRKDR